MNDRPLSSAERAFLERKDTLTTEWLGLARAIKPEKRQAAFELWTVTKLAELQVVTQHALDRVVAALPQIVVPTPAPPAPPAEEPHP